MKRKPRPPTAITDTPGYDVVLAEVAGLLESARRASARAVNSVLTATYWQIGRRLVEQEQRGNGRAGYGDALLPRLARDLTTRFGRGFSRQNLQQMRQFYQAYPPGRIRRVLSGNSVEPAPPLPGSPSPAFAAEEKCQTASGVFDATDLSRAFPLPWSHYVRLLTVRKHEARRFYEAEAVHGGWSLRQLDRQIGTQFYERTLLSRNKAAMLTTGQTPRPEDAVTAEEEVKDPFVLEFLGLNDEYSESDLEAALIRHLEGFLLELGGDFAFVGRQRRLRVGNAWYRIDLLFFHRRLRCLVVIDLKTGPLTHADAGQMHLYCNYAAEHWTNEGENPPVGLILCAERDAAVAHYALDNLPNKVLAAEYRTALPDARRLEEELDRTRHMLEGKKPSRPKGPKGTE